MPRSVRIVALVVLSLATAPPVPAAGDRASPSEEVVLVRLPDAMAFRVERPDVVSLRVRVFDEGSSALLFDSGWTSGEVAWRPGEEVVGAWRYRIEARDGRGALVLSQTATRSELPEAVTPKTSHGPSILSVGSSASTGELRTFLEGSTVAVGQLGANSNGGRFRLVDEQGFTTALIEPDAHGTGTFLQLFRDAGSTGLFFDGNKGGSGEPLLSLTGSAQSATFDMSQVDDDAVDLPPSSISSDEMFDEAGGASTNATGAVGVSGLSTLLTRTITAPSAGLVLAVGTIQLMINHTEGTGELIQLGISAGGTSIPDEQAFAKRVDSEMQSNLEIEDIVTVHGLFQVSAGPTAFRLLINVISGDSVTVTDRQLSLVYIPSAYGTVSSIGAASLEAAEAEASPAAPAGPPDEADEQAASQAVTAERVRREMAAMARRLQELEALVAEQEESRP